MTSPTIGLDVLSRQAVRGFLAELGRAGDTTVLLTTHHLADIERLCRRLVVIDHGRVVHDGSIEALHSRYGSRRLVVVDLDEPLAEVPELPGASLRRTEADGRRLVFACEEATAGQVVSRISGLADLRDVAIVEPAIEEVVARLYAEPPADPVTGPGPVRSAP